MANTVKIFPIAHECDPLTGTISKITTFTWTGTLNSAVIAGQFSADTLGFGSMHAAVRVNGIEVWNSASLGSGPTHFVAGPFSVDVKTWLLEGANQVDFAFIQDFGFTPVQNMCADVDMTINASGTVNPPPPPPPPPPTLIIDIFIIIIVIVVAVAAGLFLRAKG